MDVFFRVCAGVLITVVLCLALNRQGKDITLLLGIGVCCMVLTAVISYLEPVIDFLQQLKSLGNLDSDMLGIMLKAVGIGLVGEIAALICSDAGNSAMGKTVQILAAAVILWLSLPLMTALLELVQEIMGGV